MSAKVRNSFMSVFRDGLLGNSLTTCSRWSKTMRIMGGDFPGPYSTKFHPWCQEMLDSRASVNFAMKGAQLGVTEVAINRALWTIDVCGKDVLYVLPTAINAGDFSQGRFGPALEFSPKLKSIFTATNKVNLKQAGTTSLYIRGSRGDSNLKSVPAAVVFLDEIDEMDDRAISLAIERMSGHIDKEFWGISTPTVPGYGVHALYMGTTQEHFFFKCPRCSRQTELVWPDCVEIIGETIHDPRCEESYLKCKECGGKLNHEDKPVFLHPDNTLWVPQHLNANPDMRGFHISQLYSYTITPGELVVAYHRGMVDEAAEQEFYNSKLGLPKISDVAKIDDDMLSAAQRDYTTEDPTPSNSIITMGIDQGKTCHYVVCEWLFDNYSNDLNASAHCRVLDFGKFPEEDWHVPAELMHQWRVNACCVDPDPQVNEARRFAREFWGYVWLCRYRKVPTSREVTTVDEESGAPVATVDRTNWATAALGRFRRGRIWLPRDTTAEFKQQIKNLVRCYKKDDDGDLVATFVNLGPDHFAHALIYAEIGLPFAASIQTGQDLKKYL